jgi:hypothetical protein
LANYGTPPYMDLIYAPPPNQRSRPAMSGVDVWINAAELVDARELVWRGWR